MPFLDPPPRAQWHPLAMAFVVRSRGVHREQHRLSQQASSWIHAGVDQLRSRWRRPVVDPELVRGEAGRGRAGRPRRSSRARRGARSGPSARDTRARSASAGRAGRARRTPGGRGRSRGSSGPRGRAAPSRRQRSTSSRSLWIAGVEAPASSNASRRTSMHAAVTAWNAARLVHGRMVRRKAGVDVQRVAEGTERPRRRAGRCRRGTAACCRPRRHAVLVRVLNQRVEPARLGDRVVVEEDQVLALRRGRAGVAGRGESGIALEAHVLGPRRRTRPASRPSRPWTRHPRRASRDPPSGGARIWHRGTGGSAPPCCAQG